MTITDELKEYFAALELPASATFPMVRQAYLNMVNLYSNPNMAIIPLGDEISSEKRKEILQQLETAYEKLSAFFYQKEGVLPPPVAQETDKTAIVETKSYSGSTLRMIREMKKFRIQDMAHLTKIPVPQLENIENERFETLPPEPYIRLYLKAYATALAIDPQRVIQDFMLRHQHWKQGKKPKTWT